MNYLNDMQLNAMNKWYAIKCNCSHRVDQVCCAPFIITKPLKCSKFVQVVCCFYLGIQLMEEGGFNQMLYLING